MHVVDKFANAKNMNNRGSSHISYIVAIFICMPFLLSCGTTSGDVMKIYVDCNNVSTYRLDPQKCTIIKTGIYEKVREVSFDSDRVYIQTPYSVVAYNDLTTDSLFTCSRRGRREDEVVSLDYFWICDGTLQLYDFNSSKVLRFDASNGAFLGSVSDLEKTKRFSTLIYNERFNNYIGLRTFTEASVPDLSIYDSDYHYVRDLDSPIKKSGITLVTPFRSSYDRRILYHRAFEATIYRIDELSLTPEYYVDFGNAQIPVSYIEGHNEFDILNYWGNNQNNLAAFIGNIDESKDYLFFSYRFSEYVYLVKYDKKDSQSKVIRFETFDNSSIEKMTYHNGFVYVLEQSENEGGLIYKIPVSEFV